MPKRNFGPKFEFIFTVDVYFFSWKWQQVEKFLFSLISTISTHLALFVAVSKWKMWICIHKKSRSLVSFEGWVWIACSLVWAQVRVSVSACLKHGIPRNLYLFAGRGPRICRMHFLQIVGEKNPKHSPHEKMYER